MKREVLEFIKENDVKFIRLAFCDLFGEQKNLSIMASEAERSLEKGISFDASCVKGYADVQNSQLYLKPEVSTVDILPWRPSHARVVRFYTSIMTPQGEHYEKDMRHNLKNVVDKYSKIGLVPKIGTECEFYLFKTDLSGEPTYAPCDEGSCFDISPLDKSENVRRDICLTMDEMGLHPENSHHESGHGQNEIDFKYDDALKTADNFLSFKWVVKAIASKNGIFASFMPKPLSHMNGSGIHINLSLNKSGHNIFSDDNGEGKEIADSFTAGILEHIEEITLFLNSNVNSYDRLGQFTAPKYISWSEGNRSQLIRRTSTSGESNRIELRSADSCVNPYLAFTLILESGLDGIQRKLKLQAPIYENLFEKDGEKLGLRKLPTDINKAIEIANESDFVRKVLGDDVVDKFVAEKKRESVEYKSSSDLNSYIYDNYFKKL